MGTRCVSERTALRVIAACSIGYGPLREQLRLAGLATHTVVSINPSEFWRTVDDVRLSGATLLLWRRVKLHWWSRTRYWVAILIKIPAAVESERLVIAVGPVRERKQE